MALFLSTYENKVDKKGRVSIPASFRSAVDVQNFQGVALYQHLSLPCLEGADVSFLEQLSEQLYGDYGPFDTDQLSVATMILGASAQLAFDSEGRIMVPASMRDYADIQGQAVFIGLGKKFQVWEPAAFAEHRLQQKEIAAVKVTELPPFGGRGRS